MAIPSITSSDSASRSLGVQLQECKPIIDEQAIRQTTELPGLHWKTEETITILFPKIESLQETVKGPIVINETVVRKVIEKLSSDLGQKLYPSQLAHCLFELAFLDGGRGLTPQERTENMGFLLSNLAGGNSALMEKLCAFYYAFSFEHFAPKGR